MGGKDRRVSVYEATDLAHQMRDELTGLYNKTPFFEIFNQAVKEANRYKTPLTFLMLTLDNFEGFVEAHEITATDPMISRFAKLLQQSAREVDLLGRLDYEVFAIALPETALEHARVLAERIQRTVHHERNNSELPVLPTVSIGMSGLRLTRRTATHLIATAERALFSAKETGGDRLTIAEEEAKSAALCASELQASSDKVKRLQSSIASFTDDARKQYFEHICRIVTANKTYQRLVTPHAERVAKYADGLAKQMGWNAASRDTLHRAAILHDIGLSIFSEEFLTKAGPLPPEQAALMEQHPIFAVQLLEQASLLRLESAFVLHHHERFDGEGYPDRLMGKHIPSGARIIAIAEAWDRMVEAQPYRAALSQEEALAELYEGAGSQFDPELVDLFAKCVAA